MRNRNSHFPNNSPVTIPRRRNRGRAPNIVEPELRTIVEVAPMAETRTMEELLRAPTEGYGEAIVIPEINADHFEIKTNLLQLVQASPFHGFERENPHTHISNFKRITSTLRFRGVPNDVIKLMMFPYSLEGAARICTAQIPPPVTPNSISEPDVPKSLPEPTTIPEPDVPKNFPKPNIPYPSRLNQERFREKASYQKEKIFQMFQDLRFDISFADALFLMPRFAPTIRNLLMNKEKLLELAKIPLNKNCSAMLLKKLGDPDKFSCIPCLISWNDFEADPRVPLILGRSFLRTGRALIDVYGRRKLIVRSGDERLIFHVDKHPQKHAKESIKMINFSCVDSFGKELRSNHFSSGSTTSFSVSHPSLTSFETSDSLLEEFTDELALLDLFTPGNEVVDFKADLREIEWLLNRDPSTNFSLKITIDPNPERFTDEPALVCLPPPGDDESFLKKDVQKGNFLLGIFVILSFY
ncbi:hypothetical protein Tco_0257224 [Tanacetum coccineum]